MNINELLIKYKIKANATMLLDMWSESHRSYHNLNHYMDNDNMISEDFHNKKFDNKTYEKLRLVNLFHDIIYDPLKTNNEQLSADFFLSLCENKNNKDIIDIYNSILDTSKHTNSTPLSEIFNKYDMSIIERDYDSLLKWEDGIRTEYNIYDNNSYKKGRLSFLESIIDKYPLNSENLNKLIQYVKVNY